MTEQVAVYDGREMEVIPLDDTALVAAQAKAVQEIQASLVIARRFPRDEERARDKILDQCARLKFAEQSQYSYPRGDGEVTGPSIRLAEGIARAWGNLVHGFEVLSENPQEARVKAYAWDLETNNRSERIFTVRKTRKAHGGYQQLTDPRDVYEHVANMATRRLRACLLQILPMDIVEDAIEACNATIANEGEGELSTKVRKLRTAFRAVGVTSDMIAKKLGHKVEAINPTELAQLRKTYAALKDGYTTVEKAFPMPKAEEAQKGGRPTAPSVDDVLKKGNEGVHPEGSHPEGQAPAPVSESPIPEAKEPEQAGETPSAEPEPPTSPEASEETPQAYLTANGKAECARALARLLEQSNAATSAFVTCGITTMAAAKEEARMGCPNLSKCKGWGPKKTDAFINAVQLFGSETPIPSEPAPPQLGGPEQVQRHARKDRILELDALAANHTRLFDTAARHAGQEDVTLDDMPDEAQIEILATMKEILIQANGEGK